MTTVISSLVLLRTATGDQNASCLQVLANEAMKPAKLKRHLITKHPEYKYKTKFFSRKSKEYTHQKTRMVNLATTSEKAQKASYLVAQHIAKSKQQHTLAQELVLPVAVEMCEVITLHYRHLADVLIQSDVHWMAGRCVRRRRRMRGQQEWWGSRV